MKFTKAAVENLTLPKGKLDHIEWDDALSGFGVRLRAGKAAVKRTYVAQYRLGHQQRRLNLGDARKVDLEDARRVAKRRLGAVALGHDPAVEKAEAKRKARLTFESFVPRFLEYKRLSVRPRTLAAISRHLEQDLGPLHGRPVHEIVRREVAAVLGDLANSRGPNVVRESRNVLNEFFGWLMGEGVADVNPVIGTNKPSPPKARERVLSDAELGAIWRAAEESGDEFGRIVRLLICVPCRREEIGDLRWPELEGSTLHIPGARTKNGRELVLPLSPVAMAVFDEISCCRLNHERRIFGRGGRGFSGWSHAKDALEARISIVLAPWHLHDLRRTVATGMGNLGVQPHVIEQILNHTSGHKRGVAGVYNRSTYDREVRAAMMLWAEHIAAIVESRSAKVVPLSVGR